MVEVKRITHGVNREEVMKGRPGRTTRSILEQSEVFYRRILAQREQWLKAHDFGSRYVSWITQRKHYSDMHAFQSHLNSTALLVEIAHSTLGMTSTGGGTSQLGM